MSILVTLDGLPDVYLRAEAVLDENWNGWGRPIATASALAAFLRACQIEDPSGDWGNVSVIGDDLVVHRVEGDDDSFAAHGEDSDGARTYNLSGWAWVTVESRFAL